MEKVIEHIEEIESCRSSRRSSRHAPRESFPAIPPETLKPPEDPPVRPIDPQDQVSDLLPSPQVQSTVLFPTFKPTVPTSTDERDQSLEDALAKSRADRLARANIQGDVLQSPTPAASKPQKEATPASMEYLSNTFQQFLHYMSLHPHEPGDLPQQPAPRAPRAHPLSGDEPRLPARDPNDSRRNTAPTNAAPTDPTPTNPGTSRSSPPQVRQPSVDSLSEPIVSGKVNKIPSDILLPLDPEKGATNLYCKNLKRLVDIYGEPSVLTAIPKTLKGRAKDWFAANTLPRTSRESVASWIVALKAAFPVNSDAWGTAQDRKYDPSSNNSVMDYFYDKVNLLRTSDEDVDESDIKKSIWRGLPAEFQFAFDYDEV